MRHSLFIGFVGLGVLASLAVVTVEFMSMAPADVLHAEVRHSLAPAKSAEVDRPTSSLPFSTQPAPATDEKGRTGSAAPDHDADPAMYAPPSVYTVAPSLHAGPVVPRTIFTQRARAANTDADLEVDSTFSDQSTLAETPTAREQPSLIKVNLTAADDRLTTKGFAASAQNDGGGPPLNFRNPLTRPVLAEPDWNTDTVEKMRERLPDRPAAIIVPEAPDGLQVTYDSNDYPLVQRRVQTALEEQARETMLSPDMPLVASPMAHNAPSESAHNPQPFGMIATDERLLTVLGRGSSPPAPRPREFVELPAANQQARQLLAQEVFATLALDDSSNPIWLGSGSAWVPGIRKEASPTLAGVFSTGLSRWALLGAPDGRIIRIESGSRVGGANVVSVEANGVIIESNGQRALIAVGAALNLPN